MRKSLFAAILVFSFGSFRTGLGSNIYVSPAGGGDGTIGSPTDLQTALDNAKASAGERHPHTSSRELTASANTFLYNSHGHRYLYGHAPGGWNTDFSSQSADRTLTMLDGQ